MCVHLPSWTDSFSLCSSSPLVLSGPGSQLSLRSHGPVVHMQGSTHSPRVCCLPGGSVALPATSGTCFFCYGTDWDRREGPSPIQVSGCQEAPCLASMGPGDNPQRPQSKIRTFPRVWLPSLPVAIWLHALCHYKGKLSISPAWCWNSFFGWWELCSFTLIIKGIQSCLWEALPTKKSWGTIYALKMKDKKGGFSTVRNLTWFTIT